jgi:hypothetical protein
MLEDLELDLDSDNWTRGPIAESKRDAAMAKASKFLDDFFELGIDAGARTLSHREQSEILGVQVGESIWQTPRPAEMQPDGLERVRSFCKSERERVRSQAMVTRGEIRDGLTWLGQVLTEVARKR